MRPFRVILLGLLSAHLIGCSNQTIPSRQFEMSVTPGGGGTVVIVEHVEQSGGGDCPRFGPEKALHAAASSEAAGRLVLVKPVTHSDVWWLGLRRREQFARWTIFRPGSVVTTIYPEGLDIWDSGVPIDARINARLGWRAPYVGGGGDRYDELRPNEKIGGEFGRRDRIARLQVPLRSLPEAGMLKPDPHWQDGPVVPPNDGLCAADAATLQWQIERALLLLREGALKQLTPFQSSTILSAIEDEAKALKAGGLSDESNVELDRSVSALRDALSSTVRVARDGAAGG